MEQSQFENVKNAEQSACLSHWACLKSLRFEENLGGGLVRQHCRPPIHEFTIRNKNPKNSDCEMSWLVYVLVFHHPIIEGLA